ncbi:NADPH-dependent FMN reductase [Oceanobacillus jeddahense]|uniref:NAD(P)H-dependent oxidoreductase n=1 Tax=Oceanobacillus jeddahense TaxID=1462527 RepID=A0ABY5JYQ2_9BACI|nr:NAD(P)H-dependent oxidoreductase [Oceanobacillus jeddahense]UUI04181.1 NAD(P)H-dependent oxidoreductase [Oceanobacillus jeddahense]
MTRIGIITGSTRDVRVNLQVAEWVKDFADNKDVDAEFEIVDIKESGLGRFNEAIPPLMSNKDYATEVQNAWSRKIDSFDGFIFVTPEYNKNFPSGLKDHLDYLGSEWHHKAAGIVSYGSTLGIAASLALRTTLSNLKVATVEPQGAFSLFNDFENMATFTPMEVHKPRFGEMIDDVVAWSNALKSVRKEKSFV